MGKKGALNNWRTDDGEYSRKTVKRCDKNRYRNDSIKQQRHTINHHNYGDSHTSKTVADEAENEVNIADNEITFNVPNDRRSALKLERKIQRQRKYALESFYYKDDACITKKLPETIKIEVEASVTI